MPQRWVGKFAAVFAAIVVAFATVQPAAAEPSNTQPIAVPFAAAHGWEIGTLAYPGDEPTVLLYLTRRTADGVTLATEGTAEFGAMAIEAGFAFAGTSAGELAGHDQFSRRRRERLRVARPAMDRWMGLAAHRRAAQQLRQPQASVELARFQRPRQCARTWSAPLVAESSHDPARISCRSATATAGLLRTTTSRASRFAPGSRSAAAR